MDTTTLLIIIVVLLLLGGGWYGRGRWYSFRFRLSANNRVFCRSVTMRPGLHVTASSNAARATRKSPVRAISSSTCESASSQASTE